MYEEIPLVKGMHNDYLLVVVDDVEGNPFHLGYVKSYKVGFYSSPEIDDSNLVFYASATIFNASQGRMWIQVSPDQTNILKPGGILYLSVTLTLTDGQVVKVPIPPQIVKVIER